MKYFDPRMDILSASQQKLWPDLKAATEAGFTLYGGTAIALRLGHRQSVDFDFFSSQKLDKSLILGSRLASGAMVIQEESNTLTLQVSSLERGGVVKVSFFGTIDNGVIVEPELTSDSVLRVASLDDLMATKVKVILQRIEAKDYQDIAAMLNAGVSLSKGLVSARKLYGKEFQPSESLKAMVYFDEGDLDALTTQERATLAKATEEVTSSIVDVLREKNKDAEPI